MARMLTHRLVRGGALLLACAGLFGLGRMVARETPVLGPTPAYADEADNLRAKVEATTVCGLEGGRVTVADKEIAALCVSMGGFSGRERAVIVADRLNRHLETGLKPADVLVRTMYGTPVVQAHDAVIVTVTPDDARLVGAEPRGLAEQWAGNLREALGGTRDDNPPVGEGSAAATADELVWPPREPYDDKYVPIISLLQGLRVGVARINGPRSRVQQTQAITQFSIDFGNFLEIDIYVPVRVSGGFDRVQGVGVTGLGDIRL